jgi:hypothetical protein
MAMPYKFQQAFRLSPWRMLPSGSGCAMHYQYGAEATIPKWARVGPGYPVNGE